MSEDRPEPGRPPLADPLERIPEAPVLPPLYRALAAPQGTDPVALAAARAELGADPGLLVHGIGADAMAAAVVLAPERPLAKAMAALVAAEIGFQNALGALAPPEVAVEFDWPDRIRINAGIAGRFRALAGGRDPAADPGWLVVGFELALLPEDPDRPGADPERTSLWAEGCAEVAPVRLLEAWARHMLVWLNRLEDDGPAPLHEAWRGLLRGMGGEVSVAGRRGLALGLDEDFGLLLRSGDQTTLLPLTLALDDGGMEEGADG